MPQSLCAALVLGLGLPLFQCLPLLADASVIRDRDSFDVDTELNAGLLRDDQFSATGVAEDLIPGGLPAATDLQALAIQENGAIYFAVDSSIELSGGLLAEPGDVVKVEAGSEPGLEFDRSSLGLDPGASIDAITVTDDAGFPLAISFDVAVELPTTGGFFLADDEDLVKTDGVTFEPYFDGSAAGIPAAADLDAAQLDVDAEELRLSFDISGIVAGLLFDDEDLLGYETTGGNWRLVRDTSLASSGLAAGADLDAHAFVLEEALFVDDFESGDTLAWSLTN